MGKTFREALEAGDWIESGYKDEYDAAILECGIKVQRYNATAMASVEGMREAFSDITGAPMAEGSVVIFPFRCDLGFNVRLAGTCWSTTTAPSWTPLPSPWATIRRSGRTAISSRRSTPRTTWRGGRTR